MFKISFITQALVVLTSLVVLLEAVNIKYGYDVRNPPVFGTYSKLGGLGERESLSSLNGARVAVFRRLYNQPRIIVPVPVYKKTYVPNKPPTYVKKPVVKPVKNGPNPGVQRRSAGGLLDPVGDVGGLLGGGGLGGLGGLLSGLGLGGLLGGLG